MPKQKPSSDFYSRLCPDELTSYPVSGLVKLTDWIEDTPKHRGNRPRATPGLTPSGYVYFGQWITHDLSRDDTPLSAAGNLAPENTINARSACLDLEPLYGKTTKPSGPLYDQNHPRGNGYLALGQTVGTGGIPSSDNDLNRDDSGKPTIYDDRNDLSLLLAQLQVLLTKFHNRLLDDVKEGKVTSISGGDPYEVTRRLVTWHYQWIVRNDFLPKAVMPHVLDDILMHWPRLYRPKKGHASIPVEFNLGAFQCSHSAVQFAYNISASGGVCSQEETMYLTGLGHFVRPGSADQPSNRLPETFVVDPGRMYGFAPAARSNFAAHLCTLITGGLYKVPGVLSEILNKQPLTETGLTLASPKVPTFKLPEATLRRGAAVGLPSGQQLCKYAGVPCLGPDQLAFDPEFEKFLKKNGMLDRTPLFYYVLREAEVSGRAKSGGLPCKRLGPLGSRLVAEVLLGVLNADRNSYVHANWQPPVISGDFPARQFRIDSLPKLAFYAKGYRGYAKK